MRRPSATILPLLLTILAAGLVVGPAASPAFGAAGAKAKPPVKLEGKVNVHGTKTAKGNKIELEADDFYFGPTFVKAKPGSTLKVKVKNEGSVQHTFTIDGQVDVQLSPDKSKTVTVKVPTSGALNFFCQFHHGMGMQGAIFTKAGATVQAASTGGSGY